VPSNPPETESTPENNRGTLKLGSVEIQSVSGGQYRIDGGTLFGVVPRLLWARHFRPDQNNRILQETNCILVKTEQKQILIDTGYGSKLPEKFRRHHEITQSDPLYTGLGKLGISPGQIDLVILSHLHFDHAGGCTRRDSQGKLIASFPNAEYIVQKEEWEFAMADLPELKGAYIKNDFELLKQTGQLRLTEGDEALLPEIRVQKTGGHTEGHQAIFIESDSEGAVYAGDLCATRAHQPLAWCMSYDTHMLQTRRAKRKLFEEIRNRNLWLLLDHDPTGFAIRVTDA